MRATRFAAVLGAAAVALLTLSPGQADARPPRGGHVGGYYGGYRGAYRGGYYGGYHRGYGGWYGRSWWPGVGIYLGGYPYYGWGSYSYPYTSSYYYPSTTYYSSYPSVTYYSYPAPTYDVTPSTSAYYSPPATEDETPTYYDYAEPAPAAPPATPAPTAERAVTVDVGMRDNAFEPARLEVKAGTTVNWTNRGKNNHTVTSETALFDSGELSPNKGFSYTFNRPGNYPYFCSIHKGEMKGVVVVR